MISNHDYCLLVGLFLLGEDLGEVTGGGGIRLDCSVASEATGGWIGSGIEGALVLIN